MTTKDIIVRTYNQQKDNAKRRGIPFDLTFSEWGQIWLDSGHFGDWGRRGHEYCMARFEDEGAYTIGNVKIITASENHAEIQFSDEARARMTEAALRNKRSFEPGHVPSAKARQRMSQSGKLRWERKRAGLSN
jgi:hypothetical protein